MFVLVAVNEAVVRNTLARIFTEQDIDYHFCHTGAEIKQAISVRTVDLFVLSDDLPDIDVATLCRTIRYTVKEQWIPIVFLATDEHCPSFRQAFSLGATDVFKHNDPAMFRDYLRNLSQLVEPLAGRVLVVDSTPAERESLQRLLCGWGLQVDTFASAERACSAHLKFPYDLVLTSDELSGTQQGLDMVQAIRRQPMGIGDVPIIVLTRCYSDSTRVNFLTRGVNRYLARPILEPELRVEIKHLLADRSQKLVMEQERRLELNKSKAKTDFLARMSHELRTSLNAIIGFSNLLIMGDEKDAETREYGAKINGAGKLLLELINEVLDLSRIESGNITMNMQPAGLAGILEKCQAVMQSFASEHQISLCFDNTQGDITIRCDVTRLTEVLLNLISNAIKYNRPGGNIVVSSELTPMGFVRINVIDDGIGISQDYSQTIFEPFARAHSESHGIQGTGIGLTIALQLVELMGGQLDFSSEEGRGSHFWVDIPQDMHADENGRPESSVSQSMLMPCRVLYVDDNPVNCLLIEKWFSKQARASVQIAGSAREALALLGADSGVPDVVITDIQMPEQDGYWLLEQIRRQPDWQHLPVVALSAMAMDREVEMGKLSGFNDYLTKPFDFQVLVKTLNQLLPETVSPHHHPSGTQQLPN